MGKKLASRADVNGSLFEVLEQNGSRGGILLQYTEEDCGVEEHDKPCIEEWGVAEEDIGTLLLAIIRHQTNHE